MVLALSDRLCLKVGRTKRPVMVLLDLDRCRLNLSLTPSHKGARKPAADDPVDLWPLDHALPLPLRGEVGAVEVTEPMLMKLVRVGGGGGELRSGAFQSRANWRSNSGVPTASGPR